MRTFVTTGTRRPVRPEGGRPLGGRDPLPAHADDPRKAGVVGDPEVNLLRKITLAWTQYRAFHASLAELKGYSDRELSELGVTRADIPRLAYAEAERRVGALAPSPGMRNLRVSWLKPAAS